LTSPTLDAPHLRRVFYVVVESSKMTDNRAMKRHLLVSLRQASLCGLLVAGITLAAPAARAQGAPPSATVIADYEAKLAQFQAARAPYDAQAAAYWDAVSEKRRGRNVKRRDHLPITLDDYVLTQPPVYSGPPRPVDPRAPGVPPPERPDIPVVADFLHNAAEQFGFVPDRPANDLDFKRAYARAALAAGLTRERRACPSSTASAIGPRQRRNGGSGGSKGERAVAHTAGETSAATATKLPGASIVAAAVAAAPAENASHTWRRVLLKGAEASIARCDCHQEGPAEHSQTRTRHP
jgi:hypothetical protein